MSLLAGITLRLKLQWMGAAQSRRNGEEEEEEGGIEPERKRVLGGGARGDPAISNSVFMQARLLLWQPGNCWQFV